jgi:histidyl-tRNA synthetase
MAKKTETKPPKGMRDFLPDVCRQRRYVMDVIRSTYERYGFEPIETSAMERLEALTGKYGEEGDQLLFKVLHRGQPLVKGIRAAAAHVAQEDHVIVGRSGETAPGAEPLLADMGLRYDLTVPFARFYAAHQAELPSVFKRYQMQPVWRADTPGRGRFREFYQCDVDVVGSESLLVEVELASAVCEAMEGLGFKDFNLLVNHRALLRAMVDVSGIAAEQESDAIIAIDKLEKIGTESVRDELARKGIGGASQDKLLQLALMQSSVATFRTQLGPHPIGQTAAEQIEQIVKWAEGTPAGRHLAFRPGLARGLGYYTGPIFELQVPDLAGSLGGGGRYDGLIGMFLGRDVPACGFSLGLERILVVMEERGLFPESIVGAPRVLLASTVPDQTVHLLSMAQKLRAEGHCVDLLPNPDKNPSRIRKLAFDREIPVALVAELGGDSHGVVWQLFQPKAGVRSEAPLGELEAIEQVRRLLS